MLAIELTFLTGRYHATPWGRNVNEAVPEWPPSPYRLIRALFDTWKRKLPDWPQDRVEPIFEVLSSVPPVYYIPPAKASFTKTYLPENDKDLSRRQPVFDGYVVINPCDSVIMGWPAVEVPDKVLKDTQELLSLVNYLGRSESWVSASIRFGNDKIEWNCKPANKAPTKDSHSRIPLAVPLSKPAYEEHPMLTKGSGKKSKESAVTWLDALTFSTEQMFHAGLSGPPALRFEPYLRPADCFDSQPLPRSSPSEKPVYAVLYSVESQVCPRITSAVEVAERVRTKLMGIHKRLIGDPGKVSQKFSGKDDLGEPLKGHRHSFYLSLDTDNDGKIDHLLVASKDPFDPLEKASLDRLRSVWQSDGKPDILFVPLQWGEVQKLAGNKPSVRFRSETPFVPTRHHRKGRGDFGIWLAGEVMREAKNMGLPEPIIVRPLARSRKRGRDLYWLEFRRSRKGTQEAIGYGFELEFAEPVYGPFALGYGAHFGLGLFVPA
jgi:CRISPR-associated protein Csb2